MTGRTHDAISFASLLTIATIYPPASLNIPTAGACVVVNIIGATLPDIDQATNRLWKFLPFGNHISRVLSKAFLGHRNLTHSIIGVILVWKLGEFFIFNFLNKDFVNPHLIFASFMIGYISHLVGDFVTKDGLPLLFPLKIKFGFPPISLLRIKAGSWIETLLVLPGTALYIFWFIGRFQAEVLSLAMLLSK